MMIMTTQRSDEHHEESISSPIIGGAANKVEPIYQRRFPFQLHDMLRDSKKNGFEDVCCWLPCGTAFKILDQNLFEEYIMPGYFKMSKYGSFQRQLNLYEFRRVRRGPKKGKNKMCVVVVSRVILLFCLEAHGVFRLATYY
jgi:hypothetical protein